MKARSAFSIQRDVIFAIFVREMITRFSNYTLGNIWLVLEPLLMMVLFIALFGARGRGAYGFVEAPVFIFAAFLPFRMLWTATMRQSASARGATKGLLAYRQVRLFDVFMARTFIEGGLFVIIGVILGLGMMWLGYDPWPDDILLTLFYCSILWLFAASFGMLACMVGSVAREIEKLVSMLTMPLMFLSAVFFPMSIVPEQYWVYLTWNPILHAMELIREGWMDNYTSPVADFNYLVAAMLICLAFAMSSYRLSWRRIVAL